jgi:hypothetical protein
MTKIHYSIMAIWVLASCIAVIMVVPFFATEEAPVEPPTPIIIKVDNIDCHIAEMPTITYYVATDTARVTIECDSELIFNYLPAE